MSNLAPLPTLARVGKKHLKQEVVFEIENNSENPNDPVIQQVATNAANAATSAQQAATSAQTAQTAATTSANAATAANTAAQEAQTAATTAANQVTAANTAAQNAQTSASNSAASAATAAEQATAANTAAQQAAQQSSTPQPGSITEDMFAPDVILKLNTEGLAVSTNAANTLGYTSYAQLEAIPNAERIENRNYQINNGPSEFPSSYRNIKRPAYARNPSSGTIPTYLYNATDGKKYILTQIADVNTAKARFYVATADSPTVYAVDPTSPLLSAEQIPGLSFNSNNAGYYFKALPATLGSPTDNFLCWKKLPGFDQQQEQTTYLNVQEYGVKAGEGIDNAEAFKLLNARMFGYNKGKFVLTDWPKGIVQTSWNNLIVGVEHIELIGYGTSLQNLSGEPLYHPGFIDSEVQYSQIPDYLIKTVAAGSKTIEFKNIAEAINVKAGDYLFLEGFDQLFYGFPTTPRYHSFATIDKVDSATKVVTLTAPIEFSLNDAWRDTPGSSGKTPCGKPRLYNISNRTIPALKTIRMAGFTMLPRPDGTQSQGYANTIFSLRPTVYGLLEDIYAPKITLQVTMSNIVDIRRSTFKDSEPDKMSNHLTLEDSVIIDGMGGATGFHKLTLRRLKVGSYVNVSPKILEVDGCHFINGTGDHNLYGQVEGCKVDLVTIKDTQFTNTAPANIRPIGHVNFGGGPSLTVGAVGPGGSILIADNTNDENSATLRLFKSIGKGTRLFKRDGSNAGVITDIIGYTDGSNVKWWQIQGTWSTPAVGEIYYYYVAQQVIDLGGNTSTSGLPVFNPLTDLQFNAVDKKSNGLNRTVITLKDLRWFYQDGSSSGIINGMVQSITVMVRRPYKGTSANARLVLEKDTNGTKTTFADISLKNAGYTRYTPDTHPNMQGYFEKMLVSVLGTIPGNTGQWIGAFGTTDANVMPHFTVVVEWVAIVE